MRTPVIGLLTDFGTREWYAAVVKAVLLSRCPRAQLIDITHDVPRQDVVAGAITLAAAASWFPRGSVLLGVVDPGVGTGRALLAAHADGRYFVGPDNGLLAPILQRAGRRRIVRLTNRRYWLKPVSRTFHGRDILAPIAAVLAAGGSLARLGKPVTRIAPLKLPPARQRDGVWTGEVMHVDTFGNLITNLPGSASGGRGAAARVVCKRRMVRVVSSYAAGQAREVIAVEGSLGLIELAVRGGSAARRLGAGRGTRVRLLVGRAGRHAGTRRSTQVAGASSR
jgi:S-adenosylmethionine hydrolase